MDFPLAQEAIDFLISLGANIQLAEYALIPGTEDWKRLGFSDDIDPLLHNNSIFLAYKQEDWPRIQKIKDRVHEYNQTAFTKKGSSAFFGKCQKNNKPISFFLMMIMESSNQPIM